MKVTNIALIAAFCSLLLPGALTGRVASAQWGGWEQPPSAYNEIQRRGFMDGLYGARKDVENGRVPDVNNRDEYRYPSVSGFQRAAYRAAFRMGYEQGIRNLMAPGPGYRPDGPPMPPPDRWGGMGQNSREFQQMGFDEGVRGARRDYENGRRPDPNNRDEYRMPNIPGRFVGVYREGFRRGYWQGVESYYGRGRWY